LQPQPQQWEKNLIYAGQLHIMPLSTWISCTSTVCEHRKFLMQMNWNNPAGNHSATIKAHVGKPVRQAIHGSGNMCPEERLPWPLHNTSIRFQGMGIVSHLFGSRVAMPRE
jgi:hypothetical protein